ncbi:MAG: permease, partial [Deltaproteobacteria bacterium]|nr:permease [Deltaproteobacteria bacterium]
MNKIQTLGNGLYAAAGMFWLIFWALVLGFALSGVVMAFIPKKRIAVALGRPGFKELVEAMFFGAISSSCSYAAAAMSRSIFQKGAHIIPALAFLLASTNLVIELSVVLWIMMGWQFVVAEFVGGFILVFTMAGLMRLFAPLEAFEERRRELAHAAGHEG